MYYFLTNPTSQSGQGLVIWNICKEYLEKEGISYEVFFSERPGHITELMQNILNAHSTDIEPVNVVVMGGDGSLDESIQGITDFEKVNFGYIPTGSGNDFAKAHAYSSDPLVSLRRILDCKAPIPYDIGRVDYLDLSCERSQIYDGKELNFRYFIVSSGIGFDAAICEEALKSKAKDFLNKIGLGKLIYGIIGVKQIFGAKLCNAKLTLDGGDPIELPNMRFIVGMNTCYEGGGYKFCPTATPTSGKLELCTVGSIKPFEMIAALPKAQKGTHTSLRKIKLYSAQEYIVEMDSPQWVHTDGEVHAKATKVKISILPGKLNYLA